MKQNRVIAAADCVMPMALQLAAAMNVLFMGAFLIGLSAAAGLVQP